MKKPLILLLMLFALVFVACGPAPQQTATSAPLPTAIPEEGNTAVSNPATTGNTITTETYINIYETVNPSVVNIRVVGPAFSLDQLPESNPFFPNDPDSQELPEDHPLELPPQQGVGSGFVYDTAGHIITNNHVVADAESITVTFADGTELDATLVGADPDSDLAVIKVEADPAMLVPVALGDSESLQVGELVAAIGNPFGLEGSMTTGIVSGLGRLLPAGANAPGGQRFSIPNIIQTDTAINPGNSGGPLLNLAGEVIGVNTAIETYEGSFAGVGYAVPSNTVQEVVPQLITNGSIAHPWLGISGGTLTKDVAEAMGLPGDQDGVLISEIIPDGPASKSDLRGSETPVTIDGLQALVGGDVIVGIDDQPVVEFDDLLGYIVHETAVGQEITLHILRNGEPQDVTVILEARPTN